MFIRLIRMICVPYKYDKDLNQEIDMGVTGMGVGKWSKLYMQSPLGASSGSNTGINSVRMRFADVLLMYAEAVVMGGKATANITPLEAINKVRDRVGVPHVTEANMRTIEDERILELTYEGSRFFDLLRWGKVVERFRELENTDPLFKRFSRAQYMGFKENKNEWVPLPIDEVEGNPYITKNNPGW